MSSFRRAAPLFFVSGTTALLYQVAFGKTLATIFGATAYAVSAVLAAFMGGLALGSYLGGRLATRALRPLRIYGAAEIVVGLVCAVTPALFHGLTEGYVAAVRALPGSLAAVSAVRALLTTAVVAVPTVAMGITFPVLARAVAGAGEGASAPHDDGAHAQEASRRRLAWLYGINTAGGAFGALLAAYAVLPALGIAATMRSAAVVNLLVGASAIALAGRPATGAAKEAKEERGEASGEAAAEPPSDAAHRASAAAPRGEALLLGALAIASGLLVFAAEVVDTHLLTLLIGNSAYAFGLMLAVFLTCLAAGAALASLLECRLGDAALPLALGVTGLAVLVSLPIWGELPRVFLVAGWWARSWARRELVRGLVAVAALALPTMGMGLTFPLLLRRVAGDRRVGWRVGRLTALNTIGSIAGSLLTGYLVLPALGSEWSLRAIGLAFVAAGLAAVLGGWWRRGKRLWPPLGAAALALGASGLLPRWDMKLMTNGANVYFDTQPTPDELLYVAEDVHSGLTSVARRGRVLTLYTNGKFQGDDGGQVTAQRSFAHFPAMFVRRFDRALVIGLGTGTTLGTVASYPFGQIEVAEISPGIIRGATRFFGGLNRGALRDPRVRLLLEDGRNVLLIARRRFDLVTIELTSVWFAGAANLYSVDFYRLCRQRLQPAGVLQQWVQLHHIRAREVAVVLRSLRAAFDHVALFVSGGQGIMVASAAPLVVRPEHLAEIEARPAVRATLAPGQHLADLLDRLMLSGPELDRFISDQADDDGPLLSTDDNLYLEHATPKGNVMGYGESLAAMEKLLRSYRSPRQTSSHLLPAEH